MTVEEPGDRLAGLWAWADEDDAARAPVPVKPSAVTAVMVVNNAEEWLSDQLRCLRKLTRRPGRLIAVDNGSWDRSGAMLAQALAWGVLDDVIPGDADWSFGRAVVEALSGDVPEWIWLLHDDSAPRPDALERLLEAAPSVDVVYPKLLQPPRRNYPDVLAEVGQSITRGGHRVPTVEEGDIDQHQVDPSAVLGGSTAGMLVRGAVWRQLGGLAPEVARHRDGVDFGWRANAAGFRVVTAPDAALAHRASGRTGERDSRVHPHEEDRLAALMVVSARGTNPIALWVGGWLRAVGFLFAKAPGHARAEVRALRRWRRSRAQVAALASRLPGAGDDDISDLLPPRFWRLRHASDRLGNALSERYRSLSSPAPGTSVDELTSDEHVVLAPPPVINPLVLLVFGLLVAGIAAGRSLLGQGTVAGGGLLPAPADFTQAWQAFLHPVSLGGNAPWLGFASLGALIGFGCTDTVVVIALMLVPLLAGLSAFAMLRSFGVRSALAGSVAGAWAAAVVALGVVTAGDVSGMVLAVVVPRLLRALHRVAINEAVGAERLRRPAVAALWLVVVACVWPAVLPVATLLALGFALGRGITGADAAVTILPAWLFLGPWIPTLVRYPGRILTGADPLAWPDFPPSSYGVLAGRIIPSGLPVWMSVAFFAVLGIVTAAALVRIRSSAVRWAVIAAIGVPMMLGVASSRIALPVMGGQARALLTAWALSVVAAALSAVVIADRHRSREGRRSSSSSRPRFRVFAAVSLSLAAALVAGTWAVVGFNGAVRLSAPMLPGYVRDVIDSPRDTRALLIQRHSDTQLSWNVVDARQPRWGTGERNPAGTQEQEYTALVQAFSGSTVPDDLAGQLTALGISHVWMRGFPADQLAAVSNAGGLTSAAADDESVVWTVGGMVSRAAVVEGDRREPVVSRTIPEGGQGRILELAESRTSTWRAWIDGQELPRVETHDGRLAFALGSRSGELTYGAPTVWWPLACHGAVLLVLLLLLTPTISTTTAGTTARRGQGE